jgi:hypothetical protein
MILFLGIFLACYTEIPVLMNIISLLDIELIRDKFNDRQHSLRNWYDNNLHYSLTTVLFSYVVVILTVIFDCKLNICRSTILLLCWIAFTKFCVLIVLYN